MKENFKTLIAFDQHLFDTQKRGNADYAEAVNKVLAGLKVEFSELSEQDIIDFLATPATLASRMEAADKEEYDRYVATLPKSVAASMKFKCDKPQRIAALHKQLPQPKTYFFKVNTCRIKDGSCCFDEEALKEKCTIYGSPDLQTLWNKAQEAAKSLNALQRLMSGAGKGMKIIEDVRGLEAGLLRDEGKGYFADIDRMRELVG